MEPPPVRIVVLDASHRPLLVTLVIKTESAPEGVRANEGDATEPEDLHVTTDRLHYRRARAVVMGFSFQATAATI
jgi:hypothetical protein